MAHAAAGKPSRYLPEVQTGREFEVFVLFTDIPSTLGAIRTAARLAESLKARLKLIAPQIVPYPLPLAEHSVQRDFLQRKFRALAASSSVELRVELLFCRDPWQCLLEQLPPESIVVVGERPRWWPCTGRSLGRKLAKRGHHVIPARERHSHA